MHITNPTLRVYSGGTRDMFGEMLKFGSYILSPTRLI